MTDFPRLIEHAFPLKQASLDSVHEKNVRHGHISTLHIWPARRPLAACRAALIATLLPDPGDPERRRELCEKIGGTVVQKVERKKMPNGRVVERVKEETEGGILHWKRETENAETLEWFRQEIRKAYGGRAPKVLDPFAGGGAIPLEAMRLGCEATAIDINPVAWFILKCTLEYPQKLAGQTRPLPDFILDNEEFMKAFYKAHPEAKGAGKPKKADRELPFEEDDGKAPEADLAWHVRAWGQWVLDRARRELAEFYPTYADFEPLNSASSTLDKHSTVAYEPQPMKLVPLKEDGTPDIDALNADFSDEYLADKRNPRWVAKPTVAYLWARTVKCKNCRATIPLLKTRWLCRKANKRVLLTMEPNVDGSGLVFGIDAGVPTNAGNAAQRREHDRRIGAGTMSRSGVTCPCCDAIMTMEDLRIEGKAGRMGIAPTGVVVDGQGGKQYRLPTEREVETEDDAGAVAQRVFARVPLGVPTEDMPSENALGMRIPKYGFTRWCDVFATRQILGLGGFVSAIRDARECALNVAGADWAEAIAAYLGCAFDRLADRDSQLCTWQVGSDKIGHTFARYALPITWDFVEVMPWADSSGGFGQAVEWVARVTEHTTDAARQAPQPSAQNRSATSPLPGVWDVIVTDPPYYDAIPYSDLMDFFYVWLRRLMHGVDAAWATSFRDDLSPKWSHDTDDGELIDDPNRHGGDAARSRMTYEAGMARAFQASLDMLAPHGRLVVVFAHKQPEAWETLATAIIRAGFVVDASWPIETERTFRMRSMNAAALSSSIWLVCKKRPPTARPGWDNRVLEEMRTNIAQKLRDFWDAGIRGPDFVWAATGPALEAYSKHPVVKKANEPGIMTVSEFLTHVRRIVVDFVVGRVLSGDGEPEDEAAADRLDEPTAYYLLHRHDFGLNEAPAGTCILYAVSCGLSDRDLIDTWEILTRTGRKSSAASDNEGEDEADPDADAEAGTDSGSKVKLRTWAQRKRKSMGYEAPGGRPVPLIDRAHRLMHLWKAGDVHKVDEYLDDNGLRRHELFKRLLQSLIELSPEGSDERSLLESLSNHLGARGAVRADEQIDLAFDSQ